MKTMSKRTTKPAGSGGTTPLLPVDAPLLSIEDAATYLRSTPAAIRKLLDGRADSDDGELGAILRRCLVKLSAHRRFIARKPFVAWLEAQAEKLNAAS
jgi:hypothetical protein